MNRDYGVTNNLEEIVKIVDVVLAKRHEWMSIVNQSFQFQKNQVQSSDSTLVPFIFPPFYDVPGMEWSSLSITFEIIKNASFKRHVDSKKRERKNLIEFKLQKYKIYTSFFFFSELKKTFHEKLFKYEHFFLQTYDIVSAQAILKEIKYSKNSTYINENINIFFFKFQNISVCFFV